MMAHIKKMLDGRPAVTQRLLKGFGANTLGKMWALSIQLLSVAILTPAWGIEGYGVWLMISTIPVYLGLSDFGLGTAAGIDMTAAVARNDRLGALRAFHSVWVFMTAVTSTLAFLVVCGSFWWSINSQESSNTISPLAIAQSISFITIATLIMIQMAVLKTAYQATNKYALGTIVNDLALLFDGLGVIVTAICGGSIVMAAAVMMCSRAIAFLVSLHILTRHEPWCRPGWKAFDLGTLKRLMRPSLAALALTGANSLGLQGVVLTIGWFMGPSIAATFATTRMLTRIPLQFAGLLSRASIPELTRAQIGSQIDLTKRIMRANMVLALLSVIPFTLLLILFGPSIQYRLSHGEMITSHTLFALLGLSSVLNVFWSTLSTRLLAINRQGSYAWLVLVLYSVCAAVPAVPHISYLVIACAILAAELAMALAIVKFDTRVRTHE